MDSAYWQTVGQWQEYFKEQSMEWKDSGGGEFEQAPIGSHVARCVSIIDLGTQKGEYQGKATMKRQVVIGWELPNETMQDGKPFIVSKFYTASLSEKANLRKDLANWRGRDFTEQELHGFAAKNILGKPCMLSVIHSDKGKARVSGVMALPKGMSVPDAMNPLRYFSLDEFDRAAFDALPEGFKKFVQASPEYGQVSKGPSSTDDDWNRDYEAAQEEPVPF